jgi:hypothetical protein
MYELHGNVYNLESLLLHGNVIQDSLDDAVFILSNLFSLKHLTLYDNPVTTNKSNSRQQKPLQMPRTIQQDFVFQIMDRLSR